MEHTSRLNNWMTRVEAAQRRLEHARKAAEAERQQKPASRMARVLKALSIKPSPAAAALQAAEKRFAEAVTGGQRVAQAWVIATARQDLANKPEAAQRHQAHRQAWERLGSQAAQARQWLALAQTAERKLANAHRVCTSASFTELLDAFSPNKAIAALSSLDASTAKLALQDAQQAVQALSAALPAQQQALRVDFPDDTLDLVVDLLFAPRFDVLSLFTMGELDAAARQCQQAMDNLRPLNTRLRQLHTLVQSKAEQQARALRRLEEPYLAAAAAQVPAVLRAPVPQGPSL